MREKFSLLPKSLSSPSIISDGDEVSGSCSAKKRHRRQFCSCESCERCCLYPYHTTRRPWSSSCWCGSSSRCFFAGNDSCCHTFRRGLQCALIVAEERRTACQDATACCMLHVPVDGLVMHRHTIPRNHPRKSYVSCRLRHPRRSSHPRLHCHPNFDGNLIGAMGMNQLSREGVGCHFEDVSI